MNRSVIAAMEAGKTSITVTNDLAIPKVAMQIQSQESPKYDQLFTNLGTFHKELACFKALENIVDEPSGTYVFQNPKHWLKVPSDLGGTNCKFFRSTSNF